ncbi:Cytochrome b5-like Heme/Steroid binding domain containing protein [Tritrichomonas foetus]|uniref:Cytochrome b5-like Heme/Steroid binding domain containing protein n=1 Tax=Tritrichomonas foetus TaxID=1144522 RepID=A0A1J4K6N1_9EUKA|nr:Cytochrome b5-like Heme/Steroid binding domain containing protein [Tritrichomonas foetus]|eukprot:OHT07129.1 Cytochrome b5-like Heme/Steroid binding domain containing protein [Tritrichomonas foetus]
MERRMEMQKAWAENAKQLDWIGDITMEQVKEHSTKKDCWVVLNGFVYDITQYVLNHPGGSNCFMPPNSKDITANFYGVHPKVDPALIEKLKIGKLVDS